MSKPSLSKPKFFILSSFNPKLRDNLLRSNISITAYSFFKQIYDGFNDNIGNTFVVNNYDVVNNLIVYLKPFKVLNKLLKLNVKKGDYFIIDPTIQTLLIFSVFFQIFKGIKVIPIVTDLPLIKHTSLFFYLINFFFLSLTLRKVFITHNMKNRFPFFKSITIPLYFPNYCSLNNSSVQVPSYKYLYYAGSFDKINNIDFLIKVSEKFLSNNLRLIIAGIGVDYEMLKGQNTNPYVVFLGKVDPEYSRFLMKNALVLLNFRLDIKEITEYSFPFKMIEYIASLTPIFTSYLSSYKSLGNFEKQLNTFTYLESSELIIARLELIISNIENYKLKSLRLYESLFNKYNISSIVNQIVTL